ncbi:MAG: peptidoglycan-binding domain-containing protein [Acidobacteriota bacterium]
MRRVLVVVLTIPLLLALLEPNVIAKKRSRSGRAAVHSPRGSRGKARRVSSRTRRGRAVYAARGRRGRHPSRSRSRRQVVAQSVDSAVIARPAPGISTERATEIQNALIKASYLDGPASGQYDDPTIAAMKQFQARSGLPATGMPSAPALKKLGVSKRSNDGYAMPVTSVSEKQKKSP